MTLVVISLKYLSFLKKSLYYAKFQTYTKQNNIHTQHQVSTMINNLSFLYHLLFHPPSHFHSIIFLQSFEVKYTYI